MYKKIRSTTTSKAIRTESGVLSTEKSIGKQNGLSLVLFGQSIGREAKTLQTDPQHRSRRCQIYKRHDDETELQAGFWDLQAKTGKTETEQIVFQRSNGNQHDDTLLLRTCFGI